MIFYALRSLQYNVQLPKRWYFEHYTTKVYENMSERLNITGNNDQDTENLAASTNTPLPNESYDYAVRDRVKDVYFENIMAADDSL